MISGDDLDLFVATLTQATESATGEALDDVLTDFGWRAALADDPETAVSVLFDRQGRAAATSSALEAVLADSLGWQDSDGVVVLPALGATVAPGRADGDAVVVSGLGTSVMAQSSTALAVLDDGRAVTVALGDLTRRPVAGIDPDFGLVEVTGRAGTTADVPSGSWTQAVAVGQRALAHELIGNSRTMLRLACDHALTRIQFGQPIAGFQAVRHRLADAYLAIEGAQAVVDAAWLDGSTLAAAGAKAVAGRSARTVARHAQQVLAGIGFTTEHDLHRHVRRTLVLDGLLGDARTLTRAMGADILRQRRLPPMQPL